MAVYPTLRKAIYETYEEYHHKEELGCYCQWPKDEISARCRGSRPFPADDELERVVLLMQKTGNFSYLETLAFKCGRETRLLQDRLPEMIEEIKQTQRALNNKVEQLVLTVPLAATAKVGKR